MLQQIKIWARTLKRDVHAIYLAAHSPRVPWHAKIVAIAVAGYALSPIDLIPDFIPVLGYVDDLIIVPLGIWLVLSLIPEQVMAEYRAMADKAAMRPRSNAAAIVIVAIWILGMAMLGWIGFAYWSRSIQAAHYAAPRSLRRAEALALNGKYPGIDAVNECRDDACAFSPVQ